MNVIPLASRNTDELLSMIDILRVDAANGKFVAFACVTVDRDDDTRCYAGASVPTTRLSMIGATAALHHHYLAEGGAA